MGLARIAKQKWQGALRLHLLPTSRVVTREGGKERAGVGGHNPDPHSPSPLPSGRRASFLLPNAVQHLLSGHHQEPLRGKVRKLGHTVGLRRAF